MKKLAYALLTSVLALSGSALLVTGCGGSSGNGSDGGPDSMQGDAKPDHHMPPPKDGGPDSKPPKDGGKDTGPGCETFPAYVLNLIAKDTNMTASPSPIPSCGEWNALSPTDTAKPSTTDPQSDTEFKSIVP